MILVRPGEPVIPIPPRIELPPRLIVPPPRIETPVIELPAIEIPQWPGGTPAGGLPNASAAEEREASPQKAKAAKAAPSLPLPSPPQLQLPEVPENPQPTKQSALAEATTITLPIVDVEVPVPRAEIVSTAAVTSAISVGAAMSATAMFKWLVRLMKPPLKAVVSKLLGRHRHTEPKTESPDGM
jgi:hypothetical protein